MENYYEILSINVNASSEAIKAAWRIAVRRNHPDRFSNLAPEEMVVANMKISLINEAYATLSNEYERKIYDLKIGIKSASCSLCGKDGKIRLGRDNKPIAICESCIDWNQSIKL